MFSTYFYIFILVYQLFISDNSGLYNNNIGKVNQLITNQEYKKAYLLISKLHQSAIFENSNLTNCKILLGIKLNLQLEEILTETELENYQKAIIWSKLKQNNRSLNILRREIILNSNDSIIKLYEIYSAKIKNKYATKGSISPIQNSKIDETADAMAILNLMKKKEKYLLYTNGIK